jgi:gamma-glutamyltranspeptidase/glutathione hydrolase
MLVDGAGRSTAGWPGRRLFTEAERLARDGFVVSPRLAGLIAATRGQARTRWADGVFHPAGRAAVCQAGDVLRNPAYAETVADAGPRAGSSAFYNGPGRATRSPRRWGRGTETGRPERRRTSPPIEPIERGALCRPFRIYIVCVPPPPSSGVAVLQLLAMAEQTPDGRPALARGETSAEAWTAFAQTPAADVRRPRPLRRRPCLCPRARCGACWTPDYVRPRARRWPPA